jgi:glutamyl-tRNA synthetase/glutamyl-Q tRNA(Asp) synthetase
LLEDLEWLGFRADVGPVRQSDADGRAACEAAFARLRADGLVYGCDCSRSTFSAWARDAGRPWAGPGCPGACQSRDLAGPVLRVALGDGGETWTDARLGPASADVAQAGDLPIRDRHGDWTYGFCVVVDDLRQGVGLVVRGEDLRHATGSQIRLARVLGRTVPPTFLHHPLIHRPDGRKLSKSSGDTGVRDLRAAGHTPADVIAMAAAATGWADS